ncbi:MAG TPA: ABC transporter substrate-binding protein [Stellaceae bacterium]|nr:ABC transporter substrate-binding protein [Stellaceae bacterium]
MWITRAAAVAVLLASALCGAASARTFRWANDGDSNSMDPYGRQETFLLSFDANMYEPLVRRDRNLKLEPALATAWRQTAPDVWRFTLRHGVTFHDGTPFSADDVVFSFARVTGPGSNLAGSVALIKEARKIDDDTVDLVTRGVDPILPEEITNWGIMSKAWCEKNNATRVADLTKSEENYATNHANGTGPFMLKERQPDVETTLVRNPNWWDKPEFNIDEAVFHRIADAHTRVAALLSGDLDMIYTVPVQDIDTIAKTPHLRIISGPELRTIYLSFDVDRPELLESNIKGKNPMKDIRVRKAFYQAIDEDAIKSKVMRGYAVPTGLMVGPGVNGFDEALNKRLLPYDPAAAKKLLAEAGYPSGFEIGMDCPNDRYINDEQICTAVVAMLARIGVTVHPLIQTRAKFFAKVLGPGYNTSFYLLGWTPATYDAHNMLLSLVVQRTGTGRGDYNCGGYSNPKVETLVDEIQSETDPAKRTAELHEALEIIKEDVATVPLHQQVLFWAVRDTVELVQQADNFFALRFVKMK